MKTAVMKLPRILNKSRKGDASLLGNEFALSITKRLNIAEICCSYSNCVIE